MVITNIQIILNAIPRGLDVESDRYKIDILKPDSYESPSFPMKARESCVGDTIEGIVMYMDPSGKQQTTPIEPFEICYVCNLLVPIEISKKEFDEKIETMEGKKIEIESHLDVSDLGSKIESIVKNCNFALLEKMKKDKKKHYQKIEAFAQGLYDKQDVALSVAVEKVEKGSKLVVEAMSDRAEKVTDLLKDFSIKLDDIKSDTELIKEYTAQIETIFEQVDNLEAFLQKRLGSEFSKIKSAWKRYKRGAINKKGLIMEGVKILGKRFIKSFVGKPV